MSRYEPFASFDQWVRLTVDPDRWGLVMEHVAELRSDRSDLSWLDGPLRAAAYQSGAIEGLHSSDRGLTMTLIDNASAWDWDEVVRRTERGGGQNAVDFIAAGTEALVMALDAATNGTRITQSWIRQVHSVVCRPQPTYKVRTDQGRQDRELVGGEYKTDDNHVTTRDGHIHWYAPVIDVLPEMARLVDDVRARRFEVAHPVVQAAFAHHAFTHVHPFADGNGRVARVLASVFLMRATSLPLFSFADQESGHFDSLEAADAGAYAVFVERITRAVEDLSRLLVQRLRAKQSATGPTGIDVRTRHDEALAFAQAVRQAAWRALVRHGLWSSADHATAAMRSALGQQRTAGPPQLSSEIELTVNGGDGRTYSEVLDIQAPLDSAEAFPFSVSSRLGGRNLAARPDDAWPVATAAFELALDAWCDQVAADIARASW